MQISDPPLVLPTAMSIRYSYIPATRLSYPSVVPSCPSKQNAWSEDAATRDIRIFGGSAEDGDDESEQEVDLRGRMLDVVLGLFDGIDYDDVNMR